MNGVLVLDKPAGFTSFDAVAVVRKLTGERKIGHTGTLDPMATGVLPLLLGRAAKAESLLPDTRKEYRAGFRLGERFDTGDVTGKRVYADDVPVTKEALNRTLPAFLGEILQKPPMYSAVSVGGTRLYKLARQGVEVERPARPVTVHRLELLDYDPATRTGTLFVGCSRGTYIRVLIEDIAEALGTAGVMTALRRTAACGFSEGEAVPLEALRLETPEKIEARLRSVESLFAAYPAVTVSAAQGVRFRNGGSLDLDRLRGLGNAPDKGGRFRVRTEREGFLGLGEADLAAGVLKFLKGFYEEDA